MCTGNSFRSPVAEALTRKYHPNFEVESAGTMVADHVAENGVELLKGDGADRFVKPSPDQLSMRAVNQADLIVCMKTHHREFLEKNFRVEADVVVWGVDDPINEGVEPEKVFGELKDRVKKLVP